MTYRILINEPGKEEKEMPFSIDDAAIELILKRMDEYLPVGKSLTGTFIKKGKKGTAPTKIITMKVTRHVKN